MKKAIILIVLAPVVALFLWLSLSSAGVLASRSLQTPDEILLFRPTQYPDGHWDPKDLAYEDVWLNSADGTQLHAWYCPASEPLAVILYLHGNGGNLSHRADVMGCAGHPIVKTPTLDRLAKEGVRFENMFVTTSICAASRATFFTGLYERTHRFTFGTPPIQDKFAQACYPRMLKDAGYRTGFTGKYGVSMARGQREAMFDFFRPVNRNPYFKKQRNGRLRHEADVNADNAVEFLRTQPKGKPFCLSVSFNSAHAEDGDKTDPFPWPPAADGLYLDRKSVV